MGTRALNYIAIKAGVFKSKETLIDALMLHECEVEVFDPSVGVLVAFETSMQPMSFRGAPANVAYPDPINHPRSANLDLMQELRIQDAMSAWSPDVFFARRVGEYDTGERGGWSNHPFKDVEAVRALDAQYEAVTDGLNLTVFSKNAVTGEQDAETIHVPYGESVLEVARRVVGPDLLERIVDANGELFVPKGDQLEIELNAARRRLAEVATTFLTEHLLLRPGPVVGFDAGGQRQQDFNFGWDSNGDRLFTRAAPLVDVLKTLNDLQQAPGKGDRANNRDTLEP